MVSNQKEKEPQETGGNELGILSAEELGSCNLYEYLSTSSGAGTTPKAEIGVATNPIPRRQLPKIPGSQGVLTNPTQRRQLPIIPRSSGVPSNPTTTTTTTISSMQNPDMTSNSDDGNREYFNTNKESNSNVPISHKISYEQEIPQIHIHRGGSSSVEIKVGDIPIRAQLDSGAEITIISTNIYEKLKRKPSKVQDVEMKLTLNSPSVKGFRIQPIFMKLGSHIFKERVYVAPISNDMLLGHDLFCQLGIIWNRRF